MKSTWKLFRNGQIQTEELIRSSRHLPSSPAEYLRVSPLTRKDEARTVTLSVNVLAPVKSNWRPHRTHNNRVSLIIVANPSGVLAGEIGLTRRNERQRRFIGRIDRWPRNQRQ